MFGTLDLQRKEPLTFVENTDPASALSRSRRDKPHTSCEFCRTRKVSFLSPPLPLYFLFHLSFSAVLRTGVALGVTAGVLLCPGPPNSTTSRPKEDTIKCRPLQSNEDQEKSCDMQGDLG